MSASQYLYELHRKTEAGVILLQCNRKHIRQILLLSFPVNPAIPQDAIPTILCSVSTVLGALKLKVEIGTGSIQFNYIVPTKT